MTPLVLPMPPGANHRLAMVRGHLVKSRACRQYEETAGKLAKAAGLRPLSGPVCLHLDIYRPRKAGDIDGPLKCLMDSLTGAAYNDDGQVCELHVRRFDDKANPRVEVTVSAQVINGI